MTINEYCTEYALLKIDYYQLDIVSKVNQLNKLGIRGITGEEFDMLKEEIDNWNIRVENLIREYKRLKEEYEDFKEPINYLITQQKVN